MIGRKLIAEALALLILAVTGAFAADGNYARMESTAQQSSAPDEPTQDKAETGHQHRIRVAGNVAQANIEKQVTPVYPPIAKTAHVSGTVVLHCIIDKNGTVAELEYVSGPPLLMKAAMDAVRQWKYKPTMLNGEPVQVDTTVSVVFSLEGTSAAESAQQQLMNGSQGTESIKFRPPSIVDQPLPIYPPAAKEKHIEGIVVLRAGIGSDGSVEQLDFESGPPELMDAAMEAVKKWRYRPMELIGTPVQSQQRIAILFSLSKNNYKLMASSFETITAEVIASSRDVPLPKHPDAARTGKPSFPDTLEGIQKQTQETFEAWNAGDQRKFQELLDGFAVEDPLAWLTATFGADKSAALLPQYEISLEKFKQHMARIGGYWEKSTTSALHVDDSVTPNPPNAAGEPDGPPVPLQPLHIENYRFFVTTGQTDPGDWVFSFVYLNGAFRIVGGTHTFWNENWQRKIGEAQATRVFTRAQGFKPLTAADRAHEPFIYEQVRGKMRYENDGSGTREITARLRVQTPAGLSKAGQLVFDYNAANEKIEIREVKVTKPDGSVITAGPEAVQDLSAPVTREAPMYTDARQKHVTVPGVAVGDIIEYDVLTTYQPLLPGQFWQAWSFVDNAISLDEQVDLDVPRDRPLKIKSPAGIEPTIRDERDRRIYHWAGSTERTSDPAMEMNFKFDIDTLLEGARTPARRTILFSTFQSWSEVATWYSNLEHDRRSPSAEVRKQADQIVRGQTTDLEKAQALYAWVSRNIRYVSLSFGVGRYQPHAATEVLQNRYGDCKDKTTLLEAFFESEGLHGSPVLINSRGNIDPDVPTPQQFDHAITFISIAGQDHWLDPTEGIGPFGYLLPQLRGKNALIATSYANVGLRKTPQNLPYPALYQLNIEGSVSETKDIDMKFSLDTRGDLEVLLRAGFLQMSRGQLTTLLENMKKGANASSKTGDSNVTFSDLKGSDPSDTSIPFHVELRMQGRVKENKNVGATPSTSSREQSLEQFRTAIPFFLPPLTPSSDVQDKTKPQLLNLRGERELSLNVVVETHAANRTAFEKPIHIDISKDFAEFKVDFGVDGQTVRGKVSLHVLTSELPASEADDYAAFVKAVGDSLENMVPKPASADLPSSSGETAAAPRGVPPVVIPGGEFKRLYAQGIADAKQQDYANAVEKFTAALKLDSKDPGAWRELGRSQMYLQNYAEAESAFRKYLALAPDDRFAYSNMSWVLFTEKKFQEDADLLEKRVLSASNDGDANSRLGSAYLALHEPEKALPILQKAISITPNYEPSHYGLARAYLQLGQNDSAAAEFGRAIELSDTANTRNIAAYDLARANTHLEIAEAWSEQSIQSVGLELAQAKFPLQPSIMRRVTALAAYWDTLGWIKFQQGKFDVAEKYLRASAQLADDTTVLTHLGKAYEAQKRKPEAIQAYAESVAGVPATRTMNEDEEEAHSRLVALVGSQSAAEDRVKKSRADTSARRSVSIPNSANVEGFAQYAVIVGRGSKIVDIQELSSDDSLIKLRNTLQSQDVPQSFPDDTIEKLPRTGSLACPRADAPCTFVFSSAGSASRVVPTD